MTARSWATELLRRRDPSFAGKCVLSPLSAASCLWGGLMRLRRGLYRAGCLRSVHPGVPTLCVGNIAVGGTGKTPCVEALCRMLADLGRRPAVLSRGYGGTAEGRVETVSDGAGPPRLGAREAGDEPLLLARRLPGVPVVIGADRAAAAREAVSRWGADVLVLDDGFQHLRLRRDVNVVLLDASEPFGNGRVLPRGMLRETPSALRDAHLIVLTRASGVAPEALSALGRDLSRLAPGAPVVTALHAPEILREWPSGEASAPSALSGMKILAFSGIGKPEAFFADLEALGAKLVETAPFPDHHVFEAGDLELLLHRARLANAERLVTTEKDAVRLERFLPLALPVSVLTLRMDFSPDDAARVRSVLKALCPGGA